MKTLTIIALIIGACFISFCFTFNSAVKEVKVLKYELAKDARFQYKYQSGDSTVFVYESKTAGIQKVTI